jgi:acetyl esterase/lipase
MRHMQIVAGMLICLAASSVLRADDQVKIVPDVVYGHKFGLALTFDVFQPQTGANGAGVLFMVSGGWYSHWQPPEKSQGMFKPLTDKGFTVFAVRHGSSPKFGIPEALEDVRRAVRYIRGNAERFGVDPQRLGVYGYSAGGHLSLMLGTASDEGNPQADDPVLRTGNRVQAVVAVVAPTDLRIMVWKAPDHLPAYDRFPALDLPVEEAARVSPLLQVTADDAPTLLIAGDADELVPVKHSRDIQAAFQDKGVTSQLVEIAGAGHGFRGDEATRATQELVAWFEAHLTTTASTEP